MTYSKRQQKTTQPRPTFSGPRYQVGSKEHAQSKKTPGINLSHSEELHRSLIPVAFSKDNFIDAKYLKLQQTAMDIGWRLNRPDKRKEYFTHPTYSDQEYPAYRHSMASGGLVYLPIVVKEEDPKGLGCSFIMNYRYRTVETNEWKSIRNTTRVGKRKANYEDYYTERQDKREMCRVMSKTDKSVVVWEVDTPRCGTQSVNDMNVKIHSMFGDEHNDEYNNDEYNNEQY